MELKKIPPILSKIYFVYLSINKIKNKSYEQI
jgi:hypothetical protein